MSQRRAAIVALVEEHDTVSFAQLKAAFPRVSEMTLRTDLKTLDAEGRLVRIHGGAKSLGTVIGNDDFLGRRAVRNVAAKEAIAAKARTLVQPNMTIFIDSGSTTTLLAQALPDEPITIFTNSLSCAIALARLKQPRVSLLGGEMNRYALSVTGLHGLLRINQVNFDLAFIGTTSYCADIGFACNSEADAEIKRAAIKRAGKTAVLVDASKMGQRSTYVICSLGEADVVITDSPSESLAAECARLGVTIL